MESDPSGGVRPAVGKDVDLEPGVGGDPFGELGGEPLRPAHQTELGDHHRYSPLLFHGPDPPSKSRESARSQRKAGYMKMHPRLQKIICQTKPAIT